MSGAWALRRTSAAAVDGGGEIDRTGRPRALTAAVRSTSTGADTTVRPASTAVWRQSRDPWWVVTDRSSQTHPQSMHATSVDWSGGFRAGP